MNWPRNLSPARARVFECVGKTYHFECPHCHYRAKVSGGADSGAHCEVQTVVCHDCGELIDVFTKVRRYEGALEKIKFPAFFRPEIPPVVLRDKIKGGRLVWQKCVAACPVNPKHQVDVWNDLGRCPRCRNFMEKNGFPTRIWD